MRTYCPQLREIAFHNVDYSSHHCVQGLLRFYWEFKLRADSQMNTELMVIYMDLEQALEEADFTAKQKRSLQLYMQGWSLEDISIEMGFINKSTVSRHIALAVKKVVNILS